MIERHPTYAGKLLRVESGEYSDYQVHAFFVVLQDFIPLDELDLYLAEHPEQKEDYNFRHERFLAYLLAKGLLLEIDHDVLHVGAYSCPSVNFTPANT